MTRWMLILMLGLGLGCGADEVVEEMAAAGEEIVAEVTEAAEPVDESKPITLTGTGWNPPGVLVIGPVDPELVERARSWAEANLAIPVPLLDQVEETGVTLTDAAQQAAGLVGENDVGVIALVWTEEFYSVHGFLWPEDRVVLVNVRTFLSDDPDAETLGRRVERQVVRGVCMLMGLEYSPNPMSAMWSYTKLEELDEIGRNLDPPWLKKLQERAMELGIPVDESNPFFILR